MLMATAGSVGRLGSCSSRLGHYLNEGADQEGTKLQHWHRHMMIYAPYFDNKTLGDNPFGSLPIVGDDAGTPFAVIYMPLDHKLTVPIRP
jgi:hypothetical protein